MGPHFTVAGGVSFPARQGGGDDWGNVGGEGRDYVREDGRTMRIVSFVTEAGEPRVGVLEREDVLDITSPECPCALRLVEQACESGATLAEVAREAARGATASRPLGGLAAAPEAGRACLRLPLEPPEVWGAGITYQRTATRYDEGAAETVYTRVYEAERPELFFKATAARCVGPGEPITLRSDSAQTSTEPELAVLLGPEGQMLALLCCNDVTARDIEYENPLYLPQAKIYRGSCALGPWLVTPDEVTGPHELEVVCTIQRGAERWEGRTSTALMRRRVEDLAAWLTRDNPIPPGTVLTTGTGIVPPVEWCLQEGDVVHVAIEGVGLLSNPVARSRHSGT
jgi:2-dehydro-3-deoxy-D-arabinonate dehydratase